jgi:hypothetical protein
LGVQATAQQVGAEAVGKRAEVDGLLHHE